MNHPEVLLIPVLMLSDYLLTVAGARAREGVYADHFQTQHYELNPVWQAAIARKRWFNPRHLVLTFIIAAVFYGVGEYLMPDDDPAFAAIMGALLVLFGVVNGRHLANLATFAWIRRHPDQLSGRIAMAHELVLWLSTFQLLGLLLPLALLALFAPTPAILGGLGGIAILLSTHIGWLRRWRQRQRREAAAASASQATPQVAAAAAADSTDSSVPSSSASATNLP
ncbi:MAG TPA: hypothetical protein VGC55_07270 [Dokdonella sp.]